MFTRHVRAADGPRSLRSWWGWRVGARVVVLALLALLSSCGGTDRYVWVQSLPPPPVTATNVGYVIGVDDALDVKVYNEERLSGRFKVRTDGRITLPLLGDIDAVGKTPAGLAAELQARLQQFIKDPTVTIGIDTPHVLNIIVLGEVTRPGVIQVPQRSPLLAVLALAGGFTENADQDSIFLVRRQPAMRVRFTYKLLTSVDGGAAAAFPLQDGDVVTVE